LKLNETYQLLVYAYGITWLGKNKNTLKKDTEALLDTSKEDDLDGNAEKTKYMFMYYYQNAGQNHHTKMANMSFQNVA
jgi:hypothetical protein